MPMASDRTAIVVKPGLATEHAAAVAEVLPETFDCLHEGLDWIIYARSCGLVSPRYH